MTRYYIYIEAGTIIDDTTAIYSVAIGASRTGQRDLQFLQRYAADHGHYFQLRTADVTAFVREVVKSIGRDLSMIIGVKARDFVRSLKNQTRPTLSPNALHNAHMMRFHFDLDYRISCNLNRRR